MAYFHFLFIIDSLAVARLLFAIDSLTFADVCFDIEGSREKGENVEEGTGPKRTEFESR
jgi:hypothetical protein